MGAHFLAAIASDALSIVESHCIVLQMYGAGGTDGTAHAAKLACPAGDPGLLQEDIPEEFLDRRRETPIGVAGLRHGECNGGGDADIDDLVAVQKAITSGTGCNGKSCPGTQVSLHKGIESEGTAGKGEHTAHDRGAVRWSVTAHPENTVENGHCRGNDTMNVYNNRGEKVSVSAGPKVPSSLGEPAYESKGVLGPEGQAHHAMCLQLRDVDDEVISGRVLTEKEFLVGRYTVGTFDDFLRERGYAHAQTGEHLQVAPVLQDTFQGFVSGTVSQEDGARAVFQEFNKGLQKNGMGRNGLFGGLAGQKVRFDKNRSSCDFKTDPVKTLFEKIL